MIITQNSKMQSIIRQVNGLSDSDCTVLIKGETGTGKEILADYIQKTSKRGKQRYIKINLAAVPRELIESELFGHEKGSFTSANSLKKGIFEEADRGTIFLDDIDDLLLGTQPKILRILESNEFMRVGGTKSIKTDVRVISATKVNLNDLIRQNKFRADLYYRLNVYTIDIPPLRERKEDIRCLLDHFLLEHTKNQFYTFSEKEYKILENYNWPGNVRELKNLMHKIYLLKRNGDAIIDIFQEIENRSVGYDEIMKNFGCLETENHSLTEILECLEKKIIENTLNKTEGNISKTAVLLKLKPSTLRDKIKKYQLLKHTENYGNS